MTIDKYRCSINTRISFNCFNRMILYSNCMFNSMTIANIIFLKYISQLLNVWFNVD